MLAERSRTGRLGVAAAVLLVAAEASAAEPDEPHPRPTLLVGATVSYFIPTKEDRPINSGFIDALFGVELWELLGLSVHGGLTGTVASGYITEWGDDFVDVRYDTSTGGLGPMVAVRFEPLRPLFSWACDCAPDLSLSLDVTGALVLYTSDFPPGGDIYNFVWRVGGELGYAFSPRWRLELGGRWMHVSNGQGLGPFNPSYEGAGVTLGSQFRF
ncbi:MAG: hypothetical protein U0271_39895 [Polyangiaceae bacterium]